MPSISAILESRPGVIIKDLVASQFAFNGKRDELILDFTQERMLGEEIKKLDEILTEVGWVAGAIIQVVRVTKGGRMAEYSLKYELANPNIPMRGNEARIAKCLTRLSAPSSADIVDELR